MVRHLTLSRWLGRLAYSFRGKRKVRIHLNEGPTLEGLLLGRWAGHYVLAVPKLIKDVENSEDLTGMVEVPAEKVSFIQVLP